MRIGVYSQGNFFVCLLLGILPFLCSCSKNYAGRPGEQPPVASATSASGTYSGTYVTQNDEGNLLQTTLQALQKDPASINTLRVPVNGREVSFLTAAMMLGEDSAIIESLLNQGADIKAADREGNGILHALVRNSRLSDQQKADLINYCFDRVNSADDIKTNATYRGLRSGERSLCTPWIAALDRGDRKTAMTIVDRMSCKAAYQDGLHYAVKCRYVEAYNSWRGLRYDEANVEDKNLIQMLLDRWKESQEKSLAQVTRCFDRYIPEDLLEEGIAEYLQEPAPAMNLASTCNFAPTLGRMREQPHVPFWAYAWIANEDIETAVQMIRSFPYDFENRPMYREEIATEANEMLAINRRYSEDDWGPDYINGWQRIKAAFVDRGISGDLFHD